MSKSKWLILIDDIRWTYSNPPKTLLSGIFSVLRLIAWHTLIKHTRDYFIGQYHGMHFLYDTKSDGGAVAFIVPDDDFRIQTLISLLKPNNVYMDVGANVGTEVLLALQKGAIVHAFEPTERTFTNIQINVALNNLSKKCYLVKKAVSQKKGMVKFFVGDEGISLTNSLEPHSDRSHFVKVEATTLDEYCRHHKIDKIDLLKIDVEGAERAVLKGATSVLKNNVVKAVFWESNLQADANERAQTFELLSKYGYLHFGTEVRGKKIILTEWQNHHDCLSLTKSELRKYKQLLA